MIRIVPTTKHKTRAHFSFSKRMQEEIETSVNNYSFLVLKRLQLPPKRVILGGSLIKLA